MVSYREKMGDTCCFEALTENGNVITAVVMIEGMHGGKKTDGKKARDYNFNAAFKALSEKTGLSIDELEKMQIDNNLTWHECNDMKSMQLVPTILNGKFKHLGGVGEINLYFDLVSGIL